MNGRRRPSLLDRFLRLFADVRAGEGVTVLLLAVNVFLILAAYYVIKPIRDGLAINDLGAEVTAFMYAGMAFLLIPTIAVYGKLADRLPRRRLINVVTVFFAACLIAFSLLGRIGVSLGFAFFIWTGIFNVMIVAQIWSFANDLYTNEEGERLFPIVQVGGSLGAVLGIVVIEALVEPLGVFAPMLLAAAVLVVSLLLTNYLDRRERRRTEAHVPFQASTAGSPAATGEFRLDTGEFKNLREAIREALEKQEGGSARSPEETGGPGDGSAETPREDEEPSSESEEDTAFSSSGAFQLVLRTRYLLLAGLLLLLLNWVNTTGGNILNFVVEEGARTAVAEGRAGGLDVAEYSALFFSRFYLGVNVLSLTLQFFFVSRIIKYLGVHVAILILPLISLGAYALIAFYPLLTFVRWGKTAENSTDYSLHNTVRQTLFLPTTREQKYKAKQAIDSFFWRAGDFLAGLTVLVAITILGVAPRHLALVNLALVAVWLFIAWRIGRMYRELVASGRPPMPADAAARKTE